MRQLTCISVAIAMSACVSVGGIRVDPSIPVLAGGAVVAQIRAALARVSDEIPAVRARLHPVRCESRECYSAEEVEAAIAKIRRDVQAAFPDEALASRISLDDAIAQLGTFAAMETATSIQLVRNGPASGPPTYDGRSVDTAFQRIRKQIDQYLAHPVLNPNIRISSNPAGATFEMLIGDNEMTRLGPLTTDGELYSVWRGRYRANVQKPGYRDAKNITLDLINDPGTKLNCKLVAIDASDESNCRLEK